MRLLRDEIITIGDFIFNTLGAPNDFDAERAKSIVLEIKGRPGLAHVIDHDTLKDFGAAHEIVQEAKTIVVPSDLIRQFVGIGERLKRQDVPWKLPFNDLIVQFTHPIPESEFFVFQEFNRFQIEHGIPDDTVDGMMLGHHRNPANGRWINTVIAIYGTRSVNRVAWWDDTHQFNVSKPVKADNPNKLRLLGVALATVLFLNAENVHLEYHEPDRKVQERRERKGKRKLGPYYTTYIRKVDTPGAKASGTGTPHSYLYPVRGHFRHFANGGVVWIPPHYRGLAHAGEPMPAERIYRVVKPKENTNEIGISQSHH